MTIRIKFVDRKDEMKYFETEYKKKNFRFISIIGRRRLGKTRFIEEFLKGKSNYSYFLVPDMNDNDVRMMLSERLHEDFGISFIGLPSWEEIFEKIFAESQKKRIIMAFDEFQRFFTINRSVFSLLQKLIDKHGKKSKMLLIVSGSSIGMMYKIFDHASALYGRRTGQINFQALNFFALREWFPSIPLVRLVEIYAIYGGTPKYLEDVESDNIMENIKKIISKTSILYNEPEILIKTELSDSNTYFNILKYISYGVSKSSEIADGVGIKTTSIDYFLNVLMNDMDIVKKEVPITEEKPWKSKKSRYFLKDNFFRFWFKYIYPSISEIEIGNAVHIRKKIESELNVFIGLSFEEISKQVLLELNKNGNLPFSFTKIGRQWGKFKGEKGKNTYEIDLAALNENTKEILFVECKWKDNTDAKKILEQLKEKTKYVQWNNNDRKEYFAIFAKTFKRKIKEPNLFLFDLKDIDRCYEK